MDRCLTRANQAELTENRAGDLLDSFSARVSNSAHLPSRK
jgi:hypothetical protein